ncbi:antitoxin MazE-like protein [Methylobacterium sp. sgz302541]|uniref:antitoxin MazE-like protein n=1 Tax=unclassified Methylobacterium TaxID=2615210 RepID=UPI003D341EB6
MAETEAMRQRDDNLRSAGLRPVEVWLPDTRTEIFAAECARQARLIRNMQGSAETDEDEAWFAASDRAGWTA